MYTAQQIEEAINAEDEYGDTPWSEMCYEDGGTIKIDGVDVPWKMIHADTGGEGHGEEIFFVIDVLGTLYRKDGFYASHEGSYWDGPFREVTPVVRPVTFYE